MIATEKYIFMDMFQLLINVSLLDILLGLFLQKIILAHVN